MSDHGHRTFVGTLVFLDVLDPRPDALECVQVIGVVVASGEILDGDQPSGTIGGDSTAELVREARLE